MTTGGSGAVGVIGLTVGGALQRLILTPAGGSIEREQTNLSMRFRPDDDGTDERKEDDRHRPGGRTATRDAAASVAVGVSTTGVITRPGGNAQDGRHVAERALFGQGAPPWSNSARREQQPFVDPAEDTGVEDGERESHRNDQGNGDALVAGRGVDRSLGKRGRSAIYCRKSEMEREGDLVVSYST